MAGERWSSPNARKSRASVAGVLSRRTTAALAAYLENVPVEFHAEAEIFRNRPGARYTKDTLGDDFRDARAAEFGSQERRALADFHRSGTVEAIAGGATAEHLSHAMGNTLSASNELYETYVPVNLAMIRSVQAARCLGRTKLVAPNGPGPKVGTLALQKLEQPHRRNTTGAK